MERKCQRCGRELEPGELRYRCTIDFKSMYDGYIAEPEGDVDENIEDLIEILSRQSPEEMRKDVAQTISIVVCRPCRNQIVKEFEPKGRMVH